MRPSLPAITLATLLTAVWSSCTVQEPDDGDGELASSTGPGSSSGGTGTAGSTQSGAGATVAVGGTSQLAGIGGVLSSGGGETGGMGGTTVCEADVSVAVEVGLDMYIVFDRSGSMAQRPPPNQGNNGRISVPADAALGDCPIDLVNPPAQDSRWCLASNALAGFFAADPMGDVRAALQFMTPPVEERDICGAEVGNPHATAAVELTPLPVPATDALITTLDTNIPHSETINGIDGPENGTRIEGALNGIAMYTSANVAPMRKIIGVLITDGDPHQCQDNNIGQLGQIAADHFTATGIQTFIIGMTGATAGNLETLAVDAGGPEHGPDYCDAGDATCHYWTVGDGDSAAFTAVLTAIKDAVVIACEYNVPVPTTGGTRIDPNLVAVTYNDGTGTMPVRVAKVADQASCDPVTGGWYFDNPDAPTAIRLCQSNCDLVSSAPSGAAVEILYGCTEDIE